MFWKQRSRILWLQSGDRNTKFFFAITKRRRALEDQCGISHHRESDFSRIISEYFQDIFTTRSQGDFPILETILSPCITSAENEALIALPSEEEIKRATFDISAGKAPGADGFSLGFFHTYWQIIGSDFCREVQAFFITGQFPSELNVTHIRLIPKIVSDYSSLLRVLQDNSQNFYKEASRDSSRYYFETSICFCSQKSYLG